MGAVSLQPFVPFRLIRRSAGAPFAIQDRIGQHARHKPVFESRARFLKFRSTTIAEGTLEVFPPLPASSPWGRARRRGPGAGASPARSPADDYTRRLLSSGA
jgi:hypothetical protein